MRTSNPKITTTQLSKICGVSQGTVDRALNNRPGINPTTKKKVLEVAAKYGYVPNMHARCLAGGKSMLIGIVVFDLNNDYFSRLVMEIETVCKAKGYSTVIMFSRKDKTAEIDCISRLVYMGADGIILCPVSYGKDYMTYLNSINTSVVTVGNKIDGIPYSGIDDFKAMRDVTAYVRSESYERIIYYSPPLEYNKSENIYAQKQRYLGFKSEIQGFENHKVICDKELLPKIKNNETAIICSTDYHALQVVHMNNGRTDGIIGFDNINILELCGIKLDSISYSNNAIADNAVSTLLDETENNIQHVPHTLIIRGSI